MSRSTRCSSAAGLLIAAVTAVLLLASARTAAATPGPVRTSPQPGMPSILVVGHRGAPGYRPEHTAGSYDLAARMGADFIEPDLVITKDGVLVDRHEPEITDTTDVAKHPEFAHLKRTKIIDGVRRTGWFTTDFTYAQLRTLRAIERIPAVRPNNTRYNGRYRILTLQDDITEAEGLAKAYGHPVGVMPEIKYSTYFTSIGLPMERRVLGVLASNGLDSTNPRIPVVVQSFEVASLKYLHKRSPVPLMQLTASAGGPYDLNSHGDPTTYRDLTTPSGLAAVATYARYLGPATDEIIPLAADASMLAPTTLVADAHTAGLWVVPYAVRNENRYLPLELRIGTDPNAYGDAAQFYRLLFAQGVDGVFTDQPDTAVQARAAWFAANPGA